jgi:hypothetical protein
MAFYESSPTSCNNIIIRYNPFKHNNHIADMKVYLYKKIAHKGVLDYTRGFGSIVGKLYIPEQGIITCGERGVLKIWQKSLRTFRPALSQSNQNIFK